MIGDVARVWAYCAYARDANYKGLAKSCKSRNFILPSRRNFSIILFEVCMILILIVHTACEFNDQIMKIAQGNLNRSINCCYQRVKHA